MIGRFGKLPDLPSTRREKPPEMRTEFGERQTARTAVLEAWAEHPLHARRIGLIRRPLMTQLVRRRESSPRPMVTLQVSACLQRGPSQIHGESASAPGPDCATTETRAVIGHSPLPLRTRVPQRDGVVAIPTLPEEDHPCFGFCWRQPLGPWHCAKTAGSRLSVRDCGNLGSILWWRTRALSYDLTLAIRIDCVTSRPLLGIRRARTCP
jgi:hypothetical protein